MATSEEECPVCRDKIKDPSQPSPCCGKVICQSCLNTSLRYRAHCPHCRGQINSLDSNPFRGSADRQRFRLPILPGNSERFDVRRHVGTNIQNIIEQLQADQSEQTSSVNQASLPNQNAPLPVSQSQAPPPSNTYEFASARPVPVPRRSRSRGHPPMFPAQRIPSASPPPRADRHSHLHNPSTAPVAQLNPNPAQDNLEAELDEWPWQTEITLMEMRGPEESQGSTVRTYVCPYCQSDGFDELDLRDHCNAEHANDRRRVVCPVCVALPHGDPQYYSRNFVGHLNLRHSFYTEDVTNIDQSDEINIQCALMDSYSKNI